MGRQAQNLCATAEKLRWFCKYTVYTVVLGSGGKRVETKKGKTMKNPCPCWGLDF